MRLSLGKLSVKEKAGSENRMEYTDLWVDFGDMSPEAICAEMVATSQSPRVKVQNHVIRPGIRENGVWPEDGQTFLWADLCQRAERRSSRESVFMKEIQKAELDGDTVFAEMLRARMNGS